MSGRTNGRKQPKIMCANCVRRIHQIGKKHQSVINGTAVIGSWIHYPDFFGGYEYFCCPNEQAIGIDESGNIIENPKVTVAEPFMG